LIRRWPVHLDHLTIETWLCRIAPYNDTVASLDLVWFSAALIVACTPLFPLALGRTIVRLLRDKFELKREKKNPVRIRKVE
jgi:hypothetical protein